jgi:hypothetical protein
MNSSNQVVFYTVSAVFGTLSNSLAQGPVSTGAIGDVQDLCWDIQALRQASTFMFDTNSVQGLNGIYYIDATLTNTSETITLGVDFAHGTPVSEKTTLPFGSPLITQFGPPTELFSGAWFSTNATVQMPLLDGSSIYWQSAITNMLPNTGLSPSLFAVPPPP